MRAGVERAGRDNVFDVGIGGMGFFLSGRLFSIGFRLIWKTAIILALFDNDVRFQWSSLGYSNKGY